MISDLNIPFHLSNKKVDRAKKLKVQVSNQLSQITFSLIFDFEIVQSTT